MAKTDPLNPNVPAGGETPRQGDDRMRALARAVAELMDVDHYIGTDGGGETGYNEDAAGEHKHVKFNAPLDDDPTNATNKGFLYTKDVASKAELFWEDEDGNVTQLTNAGQLKVVTASIADNAITSAKIQDDITFDQFPLTPSAEPDANYEVANKKYVDDTVSGFGQVCRMYRDASRNIAPSTVTALACDNDSYDPDNISNTSNGTITPTKAGYYQVNVSSYVGDCAGGTHYGACIFKNDELVAVNYNLLTQSGSQGVFVSDIVYCNGTTDFLDARIYNGHGSDTAVVAGSSTNDFFSVARVHV